MAEFTIADLKEINVADNTTLSEEVEAKITKPLLAKIETANPGFDDKGAKLLVGMILYRLALRTTSPNATFNAHDVTTYKVDGKSVKFDDEMVFGYVANHEAIPPGIKNPLRAWGRALDQKYLKFIRPLKTTLDFNQRCNKIGLPVGYEYLCADFLTGAGLDNQEAAILNLGRAEALKKEVGDTGHSITSIKQLGRFST
uniref:Major coat protein n=1 Tax=Raspberry leaf mottle virus TaxID=326941 RepID=A3R4A5_9CLOS|nr:major coat protein [Raspberry leaf mottle virus]